MKWSVLSIAGAKSILNFNCVLWIAQIWAKKTQMANLGFFGEVGDQLTFNKPPVPEPPGTLWAL